MNDFFVLEPTVTVVGSSHFIEHPEHKLPPSDTATDLEKLGAFAAKGCYMSFGEKGRAIEENQRGIIQHGHGSVAEHLFINMRIEGITRGLSLELNRHRHFAISQQSTRYVNETDGKYVLNPYLAGLVHKETADRTSLSRDEAKALELTRLHAQFAVQGYTDLVDTLMRDNPHELIGFDLRKWARGCARDLLPNGIATSGMWSGNIRGIRHFIESRSSIHAEEEIRALAYKMYEAVKDLAPVYFEDYTLVYYERSAYPEFVTPYRKI